LATAREDGQSALRKATIGRDPATQQKAPVTQTFGALADLYIEKHAKRVCFVLEIIERRQRPLENVLAVERQLGPERCPQVVFNHLVALTPQVRLTCGFNRGGS
jgi:hypothetical protein